MALGGWLFGWYTDDGQLVQVDNPPQRSGKGNKNHTNFSWTWLK
jgi:hypothetical protein